METHLKVTLQPPAKRHRFGVTALTFSKADGESILYSAGRDGTIRGYDLRRSRLPPDFDEAIIPYTVLCEHTDWVNDIKMIGYPYAETLASASSDGLVKIWHPLKGCLQTLTGHTDYVKALGQVREHELASGGLDRQLRIWDIETGKCTIQCGKTGAVPKSIYTLHAEQDTNNSLIATGMGKDIALWDARTGQMAQSFRAHSGMVRCVRLHKDGRTVLSGASDKDVTLHDLRRKSVRSVYSLHDDSVWALCPTDDWRSFYSGGRDGRVCRCDLQDDGGAAVVKAGDPSEEGERRDMVLAIATEPDDPSMVWVATTGSTLLRFESRGRSSTPRSIRDTIELACSYASGPVDGAAKDGDEDMVTKRMSMMQANDDDDDSNAHLQPTATIPGEAAIVQANCLNDRRHIVTRDTEGRHNKFDVLTGNQVQTYEDGLSMEEILAVELVEVAVPSWFTCDLKNGSLQVRLTAPVCFQADVYASDVGLLASDNADDDRINLGELFLHNVFHHWTHSRKSGAGAGTKRVSVDVSDMESDEDELRSLALIKQLSKPFGDHAEVLQCRGKDGTGASTTRVRCGDTKAMRRVKVCDWVQTALVCGRRKVKGMTLAMPKISFRVEAMAEGDGEASSGDGPKLTAPRFLRVGKVKDYVIGQFEENGQTTGVQKEDIFILCNGIVLPDSMSVATCAQFVWGRSGCLRLSYKVSVSTETEN